MRRIRATLAAITALGLGLSAGNLPVIVAADTADNPSLTISQLKITSSNGQFVALYNLTSQPVDMSKYQLQYFNHYDLGKATSSKLIALTGTLPPHGYYLINDGPIVLCYQMMIDSVSLGLSSTAGTLQLLAFNQASAGGGVTTSLQDYVGWSKTSASGAQTMPSNTNAFLKRQPLDINNNPDIDEPGTGSWQTVQPDPANACNLVTNTGLPVPSSKSSSTLLTGSEPPAIFTTELGDIFTANAGSIIPTSNVGLLAPRITELLPNPIGTGNDAEEEYIELYNPNNVSFDISGYVLQTGLTSSKNYTFPTGSILPPKIFKAYHSDITSLSLSNTASQAKLADPLNNTIAASDTYTNAKDGQAWALADSKWYWTTYATPNAANVIKQPLSKKAAAASAKSKVAKTKTTKIKVAKIKKPATTAASSYSDEEPSVIPVHTRTLALVAGLALLYGAYEYRADLANRFHQLRKYLGSWRANRQ